MTEPGLVVGQYELPALGPALAEATAEWLATKAKSGFTENLLSEALLIIPIVDYFTTHALESNKWSLTGEWYESGSSPAAGAVNIDLVAARGAEKVLIEFKYLKRAADQRLIKDLVKLALPKNASYVRFLLVAHSSSYQHQGESRSSFVRSLANAGRKVVFHLSQGDPLPKVTSDLKNDTYSLTGKVGEHVRRIMDYDSSLAEFAVAHIATSRKAEENVSVFSVSRSSH